jgi:hypothetical protein
MKTIIAELQTVKGRDRLFEEFMKHEDQIRQEHPDFDPDILREQIDAQGEMRLAKRGLLEDANTPEKKGIWKRAWEAVKSFPRKHPFITTALILAAVAGGGYLAWKYLVNVIPVPDVAKPAAAVAEKVVAPTGGAFDAIPAGNIVGPAPAMPSYAPTTPPVDGGILGGVPPPQPTPVPSLKDIFDSPLKY